MTKKHSVLIVAGRIGAGKDTVGDHMTLEYGAAKRAFAGPLKELAARLGGFPVSWTWSREGKERTVPFAPDWKVGQLCQDLGTDVGRRYDKSLWIRHFCQGVRASQASKIVVTDCRFPNEISEVLQEFPGSQAIVLTRQSEQLLGSRDPNHESETAFNQILEQFAEHPDVHIIDNQDQTVTETLDAVDLVVNWSKII